QLPPLGGMTVDAFKQYVDQPELENQTADDGVTGVRTEKIAFLPTRPGRYTLPAIEVTWWNTRADTLETTRVPEREVEVLPGTAAPAAAPAAPADARANQGAPPAAPVATVAPATSQLVWITATVTLAVAWLLTMSLWWWSARRRRSETPRAEPEAE